MSNNSSSSSSNQPASKKLKAGRKPPPDALQQKFKPFVQAAYDMVSNPGNAAAVRFTDDGNAIEILDSALFSERVLPKYFKHKNISSFIRQMNMYGFEKVDGVDSATHTFKHDFFRRDHRDLLGKIVRKPVKSHRRNSEDEELSEIVEAKRAEAHQAADELARLKQAQKEHEERIRLLENENTHLTEENQRIKGAIVQVKGAQTAMTERLRRLFMYFMRYYVKDEKLLEETLRNLSEGMVAEGGSSVSSLPLLPDQQRQVISSLLQLKDEEEVPLSDELTKNHSLASPFDMNPISLPSKPNFDDLFPNSKYQSLSQDLSQHIDRQDETLKRIDTLASQLQDVDHVLSDSYFDDELSEGLNDDFNPNGNNDDLNMSGGNDEDDDDCLRRS